MIDHKKIKKRLISFAVSIAAVFAASASAYAEQSPMDWAVESGIIVGMDDGQPHPEGEITRAQLAAMIIRFADPEPSGATRHYYDVHESDWFCPYVESVSAAGIMVGDGDYWRPHADVTREEAITTVVRALGLELTDTVPVFSDTDMVSAWADIYIDTATEYELIDTSDKLRPHDIMKRGELAELLYNSKNLTNGTSLMPIVDGDGSAWTPIY